MSYYSLLQHRITTYRMKQIGSKRLSQQNLSDQSCMIQPVTAEFASKTGYVFGRTYNCFLPLGADVEISDRVVDQDGKTYQVNGTLKRNYGNNSHLTIILTEESGKTPDQ